MKLHVVTSITITDARNHQVFEKSLKTVNTLPGHLALAELFTVAEHHLHPPRRPDPVPPHIE